MVSPRWTSLADPPSWCIDKHSICVCEYCIRNVHVACISSCMFMFTVSVTAVPAGCRTSVYLSQAVQFPIFCRLPYYLFRVQWCANDTSKNKHKACWKEDDGQGRRSTLQIHTMAEAYNWNALILCTLFQVIREIISDRRPGWKTTEKKNISHFLFWF